MPKRQVVITGLGLITPIGIGRDNFWRALIKGQSGIRKIQAFDTSMYNSSLGAEVINFNPRDFIARDRIPCLDRAYQFGLAAARLAAQDASLDLGKEAEDRTGVILGTTASVYNSRDGKPKTPTIPNLISGEFGLGGCSTLITTSCAAGTYAVGEASCLIRQGKTEMMLAGGVDALLELSYCGFNALRSLAKTRCSPFDKKRQGLVIGEGACVLILESLEHALKRKAAIYAEIIGYGLSCDAGHLTCPETSGEEAACSIAAALNEAGIKPEEVGYINAHGTATAVNDLMETNAIKKVFGKYAYQIPISSIKSMLGHSFGASGAIEAAACALAIRDNLIPATINYETPDPDCDLDYVPNASRRGKIEIALSNSFAFGGVNSALLLRRYS